MMHGQRVANQPATLSAATVLSFHHEKTQPAPVSPSVRRLAA